MYHTSCRMFHPLVRFPTLVRKPRDLPGIRGSSGPMLVKRLPFIMSGYNKTQGNCRVELCGGLRHGDFNYYNGLSTDSLHSLNQYLGTENTVVNQK